MRAISALLVALFVAVSPLSAPSVAKSSPGPVLRVVGPDGETTPVVNESGRLRLKVVDGAGNPVAVQSWKTDNKSVGKVTKRGVLRGVAFGFATITASTAQGLASAFVVVARLRRQSGALTQGDTKTDQGGNVYLSSPTRHVLYRASATSAEVFSGRLDQSGYADGTGEQIRFSGPSGLSVDNRADGGLYVADTTNDCIRRVDFRGRSSLVVGIPGVSGILVDDVTSIANAVMDHPRGVAVVGSNLFVTDTENHCIWYVDVQRQQVQLVAGEPGESGLVNGVGRSARFERPSGIAVNSRSNLLAVADSGNGVVRLIGLVPREGGGLIGEVTTLGLASSARVMRISEKLADDRGDDAIAFDEPQSVSFDGVDNVYVIDRVTASVVTRSRDFVERVDLAQVGTLGDPASVTVRQTRAFVLDEGSASEASAIGVVEVGAPAIASISPDNGPLAGGTLVTVRGTNFAKESRVSLGDTEIADAVVVGSTEIRLAVPAQIAPGSRTLTVATRGGVAQSEFLIVSPQLSEIAAGEVTTIQGGIPYLGDGGRVRKAVVQQPLGLCEDASGNIFVSTYGARIRRIDAATGIITTIAGTGIPGFSGDGGPAEVAKIGVFIRGLATDAGGNLYFADSTNNRIRRVDAATGTISTIAGSSVAGFEGDGGPALLARMNYPSGLAIDARGNLFFSDAGNYRVRRIDATTGSIRTVAGTGVQGESVSGAPATMTPLGSVLYLTVDSDGNLFLSDAAFTGSVITSHVLRVDAVTGIVSTYAGSGARGYSGDGGPAALAQLNLPSELAVDTDGNLYIADSANRVVRRVDASTGIIRTAVGSGQSGIPYDGAPALECPLGSTVGLALLGSGDQIICDSNFMLSVDAKTGLVTILADAFGIQRQLRDHTPIATSDVFPTDLAVDPSGNLYIADARHYRVLRVDAATGIGSFFAGDGTRGFAGDGGPAGASRISPVSLSLAVNGDLYLGDETRIRRISAESHVITTVAGNGSTGYTGDGGPATQAGLWPIAMTVSLDGDIYFPDNNSRVRRIDAATGLIMTIAGREAPGFGGDGGPATEALLHLPISVVSDNTGHVFVADNMNNRIRRIDLADGRISTFAGNGMQFSALGDGGPATSATIVFPSAVVVDGGGNLFLFDGNATDRRKRVRRVDAATGIITTVAGGDSLGYAGDGGPAGVALFDAAYRMVIDGNGNLYLMSRTAIRVIKGIAVPVTH